MTPDSPATADGTSGSPSTTTAAFRHAIRNVLERRRGWHFRQRPSVCRAVVPPRPEHLEHGAFRSVALAAAVAAAVAASGAAAGSPSPPPPPSPPLPSLPAPPSWPTSWDGVVLLAQTHVIEQLPSGRGPSGARGCTWWNGRRSPSSSLATLSPSRRSLACGSPTRPSRGPSGRAGAGVPTLSPPPLSPTLDDTKEDDPNDGDPYSTTAYSVLLEADLIKPELLIIVEIVDDHHPRDADNFYGKPFNLTGYVGAPSDFKLVSIPFYFYGAGPEWTTVVMDGERKMLAGDLVTLSQRRSTSSTPRCPWRRCNTAATRWAPSSRASKSTSLAAATTKGLRR